jgi:hypothetical protein
MPWNLGPSVNVIDGMDCWRTWFIEECEETELFGMTKKHLPLITKYGDGVVPYSVGTKVLLEDAPYFNTTKSHHRICGPYEVYASSEIPADSKPIFPKDGPIIVYEDKHPEKGPWLDGSKKRNIEGINVSFRQMANKFDYFPFRFGIRRTKKWKVKLVKHVVGCNLCK